MASSAPNSERGIPVFMIGRSAKNGKEVLPALAPDFDIIHFCTSTAAARREFPFALAGKEVDNPQTSLGSNTARGSTPRIPAAIFVGAGFDREDYEGFKRDVENDHDLTWVREEKSDIEGLDKPENWTVIEGLGRVPRPEVLVKSVTKVLRRELMGGGKRGE